MAVNNFKEDEQSKNVLKKVTIIRLFSYMKKYKKEVILVLFIMSIIIAVNVINPILIKIAIDDYVKKSDKSGLYVIGIIALIINLISRYCMKKRIVIMSKVSNKVLMEIRQELYEHLQKLSFNFFDNRPVGKVLARVIGDVNSLKNVLTNSVISLIPDFTTIIIVLIIMFVLNVKLALGALTLLPFLILGMYFVEVRAHKRWQVFRKKNSNMNAYTHEDFSGIRVVQSFTAEKYTSKTFKELLKDHRKSFINAVKLNDLFWPMVEISWGIGTAMVFILGVRMSINNEIKIGTLIAFTSYIGMFWQPIMNLSNFYNQLITNIAGAERIFEILDTEPDIKDISQAKIMPTIEGEVEFNNVSFGYEDNVKVIEDVSFNIKKGETIALVGPTGAGKTTIVNLISRFYDINQGDIKIDGIDIKDVTIESLRSQMGIMTQDTFLFTGTIKDNIRYGKLDATDEEIIEAAKSVHAHEFIMRLENKYDTKVNERGTKLSVGQRQLIAFARTLLSKPKILILDEATSSIDTHTERLVQNGIDELLKNRTSFIIAHRLSTIQKADRIFVVDNRNILESGNHNKLMDRKGVYYNLYMAQFEAIR
ncbi:MAG: ABC transporter ATP-binding protein/permease [Vallitalea sp.]|jgi:ATP-binding cassette subfamily B protein|nr:ABC transporter ATP-binding protein/permease [Vallitalea sp.]